MIIQQVTKKDIDELKSIASIAIFDSVEAEISDKPTIIRSCHKNIEEWCGSKDCVFLKATENTIPVGYILIKSFWNFSDIFILPTHHSKGVGKALVEKALNICRESALTEIIKVNSSKNAARFYRSLGFKEVLLEEPLPFNMARFEYHTTRKS